MTPSAGDEASKLAPDWDALAAPLLRDANAEAAILILDCAGRIARFNPAMEALCGYALEEVQGRDWFDIFIPDRDQARVRALFDAVTSSAAVVSNVNSIRLRDGSERRVDWSGCPLTDEEGGVLGVLSVGREFGELAAESASRGLLQAVLETVIDGCVSIDHGGRVESFNPAAEKMFGYAASEVLGENVRLLMPEPFRSEHDSYIARFLETGEARIIGAGREVLGRRKDGSTFPVDLRVSEKKDGGGPGFTAVLRDLSEREQLKSELRQAQKLEAVGRLASGLAHEYKNLLMGIQGFTSMALDVLGDSPARPFLKEIRAATMRGSTLAGQLLAYTRKEEEVLKPVPLDAKLGSIEGMLLSLLGDGIELRVRTGAPGDLVKAGEGWFEQIILNLALNASDAMEAQGLLTIQTRRLCERRLELSVEDSGAGMDTATRARIFEPFFTTKPAESGTGLGLSGVSRLVAAMGGQIEVESAPGEGATFRLILPRSDPQGDQASGSARPEAASRPSGSKSVLVVEDERLVLIATEHYLRKAGHRPLLASAPLEALAMLEELDDGPDLLLTDVSLPQMGGRALADQVRARFPEVRVLFMSAFTRDELLKRGQIDPEAASIEKPFSEAALIARLRSLTED